MNRINLLLALVLIQAAAILAMWVAPVRPAMAQIPDPAAQREQEIQQLTAANDRLDKIIDLLSGGKLQVHVAKPDDN
jgi:hypothetical protein